MKLLKGILSDAAAVACLAATIFCVSMIVYAFIGGTP